MSGKLQVEFNISTPFNIETDYTKKLEDFYEINKETLVNRYSHLLDEIGKNKAKIVTKKIYEFFKSEMGNKIEWNYSRAFGQKKPSYNVKTAIIATFN